MKRGTIPLLNIGICFNRKDFEYDVYSLVKAFYPQSQVQMYYLGEEPAADWFYACSNKDLYKGSSEDTIKKTVGYIDD